MSDISGILVQIQSGDPHAASALLPLIYDELRKLAAQRLSQEKPGQTLSATALVHEAYLRLVGVDPDQHWNSRGHFFGAAAEAMRRILVESARRKGRIKHGGENQRVDLENIQYSLDDPAGELLQLDEALTRLAQRDPRSAELAKLHCFAGLPLEQVAEVLGISSRTAYREWAFCQAWLYREICDLPHQE